MPLNAAHLLVCERKNGNPKNMTFIPNWFCNTSVGVSKGRNSIVTSQGARGCTSGGWPLLEGLGRRCRARGRLLNSQWGEPRAGAPPTGLFFLLQNIWLFNLWACRSVLFQISICLLLLVKRLVFCFTSAHGLLIIVRLGNEGSHLRALCVGVERPPSSTGPVLCHPCPGMTSVQLCGTSIMWAALSLNENMDLRSFSYCEMFFVLVGLNLVPLQRSGQSYSFVLTNMLFVVLERNDFTFHIMIARRKVWRLAAHSPSISLVDRQMSILAFTAGGSVSLARLCWHGAASCDTAIECLNETCALFGEMNVIRVSGRSGTSTDAQNACVCMILTLLLL